MTDGTEQSQELAPFWNESQSFTMKEETKSPTPTPTNFGIVEVYWNEDLNISEEAYSKI